MLIKSLIFDFDDTIVDSERVNAELLRGFFKTEFSMVLSREDEEETHSYSWKDTFPVLCSRLGITMPYRELVERFMAAKRRWLSGNTLAVARGARAILELAVPKAIVSGSFRDEIRGMLDNIGVSPEVFTAIVSADDVTRCKPDPEGFRSALGILGVTPRDTLVFEDSSIGIRAARACGTAVAFVREFAWKDPCGDADVCFDTLEDALPWVRQRLA
jgi:beta-phosphoglucomutase